MSFIRPEAAAFIKKWREAMIGGCVLMFNLQLVATSFGTLRGIAWAGVLLGAALFIEGVRRARFPAQDGGPGVVEVVERQITYFGPHGGQSISVDDLSRVDVRATTGGGNVADFFWEFTDTEGTQLSIPSNAEKSESLIDVLSVLDGVDYDAVRRANRSDTEDVFAVWRLSR